MILDCSREAEVLAAVALRRWPYGCDAGLQAHVADCPACADVATVALVLRADAEQARLDVRLPQAGQVWWRAAVRARMEGAQAAARPLTWLQGAAGACAAGLGCAAVGVAWPTLMAAVGRIGDIAARAQPGTMQIVSLFAGALQWTLPLLIVVGACALIAPIAVYLALSEE